MSPTMHNLPDAPSEISTIFFVNYLSPTQSGPIQNGYWAQLDQLQYWVQSLAIGADVSIGYNTI